MQKFNFVPVLSALALLSSAMAVGAQDNENRRWALGTPGSKMGIEAPLKRLISSASSTNSASSYLLGAAMEKKVVPGLVSWTGDMELAKGKAKALGKPILVFQMMGRLDEEFC